eukprot:1073737-Rhodomonas_salina.1
MLGREVRASPRRRRMPRATEDGRPVYESSVLVDAAEKVRDDRSRTPDEGKRGGSETGKWIESGGWENGEHDGGNRSPP